ncbi:HutD/Ves family protein [Bdellovibrio reynosensis]|uniref:HutD family protein n=1 Tax=Bdellovibrio reynosensis TaxID=2835041 RepID=A0ABY4C7D7_9BACT|nr:HutD family protein [Bdellovibrio reynosensis]UOE99821.1 HutD family protein [Bdellovibrio reynosensis]
MSWKNGLGSTAQIDIYPASAVFPQDFLWRISSATVEASSPFSNFPGYDRLLSVWKGAGLFLNGEKLGQSHILAFPGERVIESELVTDTVVDLGIIFNRAKVIAHMSFQKIQDEEFHFDCAETANYFFCCEGSIKVQGFGEAVLLKQGDTLKVDAKESIKLSSAFKAAFYRFQIQIL